MLYQNTETMQEILLAVGWTKRGIERLTALRDHIEQGGEPGWMEETRESQRLKFEQWLVQTGRYADDAG